MYFSDNADDQKRTVDEFFEVMQGKTTNDRSARVSVLWSTMLHDVLRFFRLQTFDPKRKLFCKLYLIENAT